MRVYSNSSAKDLVRSGFYNNLSGCSEMLIATPFFSYSELIEEVLETGCFVRMIVRLGPATSPIALGRIFDHPNVHIRYFTTSKFHSKLYVFGEKAAIVGSANLTQSGMQSNREICVEVPRDDDAFDELVRLHQSYWNDADVLTRPKLELYADLVRAVDSPMTSTLEEKILDKFGRVEVSDGIEVGKKKPSKEKVFLASYQRTYQEFRTAFEEVQSIYKEDGRRQQPEKLVPLRIEIDQFFSFVRQSFSTGDTYLDEPLRVGSDRSDFVNARLDDWFEQDWKYLGADFIPAYLPRIQDRLGSKVAIANAKMAELLDALDVCHSFHDRLRFFRGGHEAHLKAFADENDLKQLKKVLAYLLHGNDEYVVRMGTCIFDPEYKLNQFGRSVIQELLGWVNKEGIPICNGRTVKALRYLGYDVVVF
jgi:hypothetical protein